MEIWDVYTRDEKKTGKTILRSQKLNEGQYHLVVHIWVRNSKGEYLIQKRPAHLSWYPNIWATTGGSAIAGEGSKDSAIREVKEELGLAFAESDLLFVNRQVGINDITYIWLVYSDVGIEEVNFCNNEVADVMWVDKTSLNSMIQNDEFIDYGKEYFNKIFSKN